MSRKKLVESKPSGITYKISDKKGKAKEVYKEMLEQKHQAIEEITKNIINDVKSVLTFEDHPKLDYKVNQAPWCKAEVGPSREGLNDWKIDLINSIHAVAPQGIDEVNTPRSNRKV